MQHSQEQQDSKKKSLMRVNQLYFNNYGGESNSKKRISWGGQQIRWFDEKQGQNWDVSPQSIKSNSDKSRSVDASNLVEDTSCDLAQHHIYQNHPNEQQVQEDHRYDRLSHFFHETPMQTVPLQNAQQANDRQIVSPKRQPSDVEETQLYEYNESGSNLLDNIDRLSRLSGLFKDFETSPIYPNKALPNILPFIAVEEAKQNKIEQGHIRFADQKQQINVPSQNSQPAKVNQKYSEWVQQEQKSQANKYVSTREDPNIKGPFDVNTKINPSMDQSIPADYPIKIQQVVEKQPSQTTRQGDSGQDRATGQLNLNLFKNYHDIEKKRDDLFDTRGGNSVAGKFSRLSEFFQNDDSELQVKKEDTKMEDIIVNAEIPKEDIQNIKNENSNVQKQFSSEFMRGGDGFAFALGGLQTDILSSESRSSSLLLENLDKVNRLSEVNYPNKQSNLTYQSNQENTNPNSGTINKNALKAPLQQLNLPSFSPSLLVNDLKSLSLEFEEQTPSNQRNPQLSSSQNHQSARQITALTSEVRTKPNTTNSSQMNIEKDQTGYLTKQLSTVREKLGGFIADSTPKRQSISLAIRPNIHLEKEIQKLSAVADVHDMQDEKHVQFGYPSDRYTPLRNNQREMREVEEFEELEKVVIRMPLNSYEKKVILNVLTPGKKSKNLQLIRDSLLMHNHTETSGLDISKQHDEEKFPSSGELLENLCKRYEEKQEKLESDLQTSHQNSLNLKAIYEQNKQAIENSEQELKSLEEEISNLGGKIPSQFDETKENIRINQLEKDDDKKNGETSLKKRKRVDNSLHENQYWQAYVIMVRYFGFEYLGKTKEKSSKADLVTFRLNSRYICSLQVARQRLQAQQQSDQSYGLVVVRVFIQSIENGSKGGHLQMSVIANLVEGLVNKQYKHYLTQNGNLVEVLEYAACRLNELEEFNRQMRLITRIYFVHAFTCTTDSISFQFRLTNFPQKSVRFSLSPEQFFNDISIAVMHEDDQHQILIAKQYDEVDKSINTQFNSRINSPACFAKLKNIIDAINLKNQIDQNPDQSSRNSNQQLSTSN